MVLALLQSTLELTLFQNAFLLCSKANNTTKKDHVNQRNTHTHTMQKVWEVRKKENEQMKELHND
jgi:hypothetical protein